MTDSLTATSNGVTVVNLASVNHPAWMPQVDATGRVFSTVIAGPMRSGKSAMLARLQAAALESGIAVTLVDPIGPDAAEAHHQIRDAHTNLAHRQRTGDRTPEFIAIDNTAHLTAEPRLYTLLRDLVNLGPMLGIGVTYTVETVRGAVKGSAPHSADNVIVLGTRPVPGGGAAEFGVYGNDLTSDAPAHLKDPFTNALVPFTPATRLTA